MSVARYYDESKNPEGRFFPGVPLADIDEGDWEALPAWVQANVDASDMYRKTRPDASRGRAKPQESSTEEA